MPSGINGLSRRMYLKFIRLQNEPNVERIRWVMLLELFKINTLATRLRFGWFLLKNYKLIPWLDKLTFGRFNFRVQVIDEQELLYIQELYTSFLFDDKRPLITDIVKRIRVGVRLYFSPRSALTNICWRQYRIADVAATNFITTQDPKYLDKMVAVLFLPAFAYQSSYLYKSALSISAINERAEKLSKLDYTIKYAIWVWFCGCRMFITKHFKEVFKGQKENSTKSINSLEIQSNYEDMLRIRSGSVTNDEATDFANLYDFLGHFQTEARQAKMAEKLMEEQRQKTK